MSDAAMPGADAPPPSTTGRHYGSNTAQAVENFPVSGIGQHRSIIWSLAAIKAAAARTNAERSDLSGVSPTMADSIVAAADDVMAGHHDAEFPVDVFQTGSGTSSNMNMNEVLASLASEHLGQELHPNDHVNASQSSNDVFPTALRLAVIRSSETALLPALLTLRTALAAKADEFSSVVKPGRTHLMDATPISLGQEFGGYAAQLLAARSRLEFALDELAELPLGGTATGNGINSWEGFAAGAVAHLSTTMGRELREANDHFALQGAQDGLGAFSAQLRTLAGALFKIANDVRLMASGPRTGLAEITLPALQPGSSIMPGKVNPVMSEVVTQVSIQVHGNDAVVAMACSQGTLELNTYLPLIGHNVLWSIDLLTAAMRLFAERCVDGIGADEERCRRLALQSPAVVTPLALRIGYDEATRLVHEAARLDTTPRQVAIDEGILSEAEADEIFDVDAMVQRPRTI